MPPLGLLIYLYQRTVLLSLMLKLPFILSKIWGNQIFISTTKCHHLSLEFLNMYYLLLRKCGLISFPHLIYRESLEIMYFPQFSSLPIKFKNKIYFHIHENRQIFSQHQPLLQMRTCPLYMYVFLFALKCICSILMCLASQPSEPNHMKYNIKNTVIYTTTPLPSRCC